MWMDVFKPKPLSRAGYVVNAAADSSTIGTGGTTVAGTATTSVQIPVGRVKVSVLSLAMNWLTAAGSGGNVTVQVFKSSGGVDTALCSATSIKSDVLTGSSKNIALPMTASLFDSSAGSNAGRIIDGTNGDSIRVDVVAASTITTQPVVTVVAELAVLQ